MSYNQLASRLRELKEKRQHWVQANKENNFDKGIKNLLTQLYPDNAHFIYELLQNAEDAKASEVKFTLTGEALKFEHNGRAFTFSDFEAITSIGTSTKQDDKTAIGKFGVGFKAVFAYTRTPIIYSEDVKVIIRDLVLPEYEQVPEVQFRDNVCFVFPFNTSKKAGQAYAEVSDALEKLNESSILFLRHLFKISWSTLFSSATIEKRVVHTNITEVITKPKKGGNMLSSWLCFSNQIAIVNEEAEEQLCNIGLAYSLKEDTKKRKEGRPFYNCFKLQSLDYGRTFIFFPAEKETSNFHFHIHAPFASTVARDSIRDCRPNNDLRDAIKDLVVDSLFVIRDLNFLDVRALAVFPNDQDKLSTFYAPIRDAVYKAFNNSRLTPTQNLSFEKAQLLYRGAKDIVKIVDTKELQRLVGTYDANWVATPSKDSRSEKFIESLNINSLYWHDFVSTLKHQKEKMEAWVQDKPLDELKLLFNTLGNNSYHFDDSFFNYEIIPTIVGGENNFESAEKVYFSDKNEQELTPHLAFVNEGILSSKKKKNNHYRVFFERIGVKKYDEEAQVRLLLRRYLEHAEPPESYFQDLITFINYWKKQTYLNKINFNDFYLLLESDEEFLEKGGGLCISKTYCTSGLEQFRDIHKRKMISDKLQSVSKIVGHDVFLNFVSSIGVMTRLRIVQIPLSHENPEYYELVGGWGTRVTSNRVSFDFSILHLDEYLSSCSVAASLLIWNAICCGEDKHTSAGYRPNGQCFLREKDSLLVDKLKKAKWIPDRQGHFYLPENIDPKNIHNSFAFKELTPILEAIGFGKRAFKRARASEVDNEQAKKFGFKNAYLARTLATISSEFEELGLDPQEEIEKILVRERNKKRQIVSQKGVKPHHTPLVLEEGIQKKYEYKFRKVRNSKSKINPEGYLRSIYSQNGILFCQLCDEKMPFRKRNGHYYFERTEILGREYFPEEKSIQYLALCPVCSAKFREFIRKDPQASDALYGQLASGANVISVLLDNKLYSITFAEKHLSAIQSVIKKSQRRVS